MRPFGKNSTQPWFQWGTEIVWTIYGKLKRIRLKLYQRGSKSLLHWIHHTRAFITAYWHISLSIATYLYIYIYQNIIIYICIYTHLHICIYIYIHWFTSLFIYLFINFFIHLSIHYISTNEKYVCSSKHPPSRITKAGRIETQLLKGMDASDIFGISIPVIAFDEAIFSCN